MSLEELKRLDRLTMSITREGDEYVAYCVELGLVRQGKTTLEAESHMFGAVVQYLDNYQDSTIDDLLWTLTRNMRMCDCIDEPKHMSVEELKQLDRLTMSITPEGDGFMARCDELAIVRPGRTEHEAEDNMLHAVDMYLMSFLDSTIDELFWTLLPEGIQFASQNGCWVIDKPNDIPLLIRSLDLLLPQGSIICLEGTVMIPEVVEFFQARQASHVTPVRRDTAYMSRMFHLPATASNLEDLANLFSVHTVPDICDHIKGYFGDEIIVYWHDVWDNWPGLLISDSVPEERVKRFSEVTGLSYRYSPNETSDEATNSCHETGESRLSTSIEGNVPC